MICHNCGKELSENARFCRYCGIPVQRIENSVKAAQESSPSQDSDATEDTLHIPVKSRTVKISRARRVFVSLLLFCIFTGGLAVSGWFTVRTWQKYSAPYREEDFAALKAELAKVDESAEEIRRLETLLENNSKEIREQEDTLALHRASRESEILSTITESVELDYNALFQTELFSNAYLQYIDDLLSAFRQDLQIDSWLYPYYTYSLEYGKNTYIDEDLWIYRKDDDAAETESDTQKFNSALSDPAMFYVTAYTSTLNDHALQNGHLYVTGLDMLNTLFGIPGYVLDGAVFVKAYGGNPDPAEMEIPGWTPQDYSNFWQYAGSYLYSEHAVWVDFGISAEDFDLDWNTLTDENAYYRAYEKFMDAVAPGLDRFSPAQYFPDDEYYGGVRYELPGREATPQEIAAAYIAGNPSCLKELGIDIKTLPSSFDSLIAGDEARLEELEDTANQLKTQNDQAQRQLDGRDFLLQQQEILSAMKDRYMEKYTVTLWVFALILIYLTIMTALSLRRLIRSLR